MEQRSEEWFAARIGKITASSVAAILGIDKNRDREDVMRDMVREHHGYPREFQGNIATQWGVTHEAEAIADFQWTMGIDVVSTGFWVHPVETWLGASPDGLIGDDEILEVKCPFGIRNDAEPVFKTVRDQPHYEAQMQIQMFVTGRKFCSFWQWTAHGYSYEKVEYDPVGVERMLAELRAFREELSRAITEPDVYIEEKRRTVDTPRALQMVAEYDDLVEAIEKAEERKKELLADIVKMSGEKNAVFGGRNLTKVEREGSISYSKAIKVLAPGANLEPWRGKPVTFWSLK